ncbi:CRISPR-associated protein Cas2 [Loigolactobacillus coryniformis subsp. coryniformis]|uniref:CRISPR-associated endoribonuclease Cas2 n=1 Tax=Loigolactobacillus coryniformis subsp. coryniformis KCTC 3167 = DSM 20001 TaxID=913848 RepID=A0A0R1EYT2_9LACO|nr:CRISPR-associated endonuclease Cas2 [Loigolactobacillus coryniformis]ATO56487.1 CRISPR-associated endonuclease Cas2 [Loigolactobacillus coryniformis subsp. coryniformis KCTC 3167 = DSM 20001]KRK14796.1 CRISPR-associated protein [Loigolactobacillus coryniformis subsp. coryniformis KCTC 3167 = DSM 20001]OEH89187.1 CRISPR-associated protein Cas2 [Loigolactobacillus coryniformis subsp. coryniformis]
MRLMIMFDLPMETSEQRKNYRKFRKALINEGFLMIQYSIYVRVCVSKQSATFMERRITDITPADGLVQSMMVTEKQYNAMHFLAGEFKRDVRNTADRTIVL